MKQMIYYVEDDKNIRELVIYALRTSGFEAVGFEDAAHFYKEVKKITPALILLDIMLPDEDGVTVLKKLKKTERLSHIPVIMLTAKSAEYDKVIGLDMGADDYVTKPFGVMELVSRVRVVLRRSGKKTEVHQSMDMDDIHLDRERHVVTVGDTPVELTYKEFELLDYLMRNSGIVLSRERLLEAVWNTDFEGESRTVDVHIGSLRQKLGDSGKKIQTVRGVGYKMEMI